MALVAVTPIAIVRRLVQHPKVNLTTITGAANIYLLFGLFWASVYSFIGALTRSRARRRPPRRSSSRRPQRTPVGSDFIYYSYMTLTTVGYGDLTAASQIGRMVSITEALVGQLYLVIVVSVLVANVGASGPRSGSRPRRRSVERQRPPSSAAPAPDAHEERADDLGPFCCRALSGDRALARGACGRLGRTPRRAWPQAGDGRRTSRPRATRPRRRPAR